jgi:RPA family protein
MKRESAWRIFAGEYNDSTVEIKGEGEMTPSYIITPLGAKVNRIFVIGVLTDVENVSEGGDLVRAHISDPTGVFTLYSGQYQKDVTDILSNIEVPAFVAVIGKVRTYSPEEGTLFVSIRPERVMEVNAEVRDKWILETCKNTKDRIEAVFEAMKMEESNPYELRKLGYSKELSEGITEALKNYHDIDLNKYVTLIQESLQYLMPGKETLPDITIYKPKEEVIPEEPLPVEEPKIKEEVPEIKEEPQEKEPKTKTEGKKEEEKDDDFEEIEYTVLETIKELEGENGAPWDTITEKCEKQGLDKDTIEEALTSLMDKGLIYEPILGTIKTT